VAARLAALTDVDPEALQRESRWLAELDDEALEDFIDICQPRTLVTGDALWTTGETGEGAFVLLSGCVELSWRVQPDGQQNKQMTQPGTLLGLAHLIHPWEHESSAVPLEATDVLRIDREDFQELFDRQHPAAYRLVDAIAETLVEEVRDANRRLHEVFGHPAETLRTLRRRAHDSTRR
ncbi:MAG: Crp/Fnr family transcriptional regulator, partial [Bradymonadaceae bacterium]